jgi:hypothetical protein
MEENNHSLHSYFPDVKFFEWFDKLVIGWYNGCILRNLFYFDLYVHE